MVGDKRDGEALQPLHEADSDNCMLFRLPDGGPVIHGSNDMHHFLHHSVNNFEFLDYICEGEGPSDLLLLIMCTIISGGSTTMDLPLITFTNVTRQVEVIDLVRRAMKHVVIAMKHWTTIWLRNKQSIVIANFMKRFEGFTVPCFTNIAIQRKEREMFMEKVAEEGLGEVQFINPENFPNEGPHRSGPTRVP